MIHPLFPDCTCDPSPGYFPMDVSQSEPPTVGTCALHDYLDSVEADMDREDGDVK